MNNSYILLVDDNEAIRDALSWLIQEDGYTVKTAENGLIAMQLLEEDPLPSLIFLDLMMPVMDGFAFREKQKANPRISHIPTVLISAKHLAEKTVALYPNELVITKPFIDGRLFEIIKQYCGECS